MKFSNLPPNNPNSSASHSPNDVSNYLSSYSPQRWRHYPQHQAWKTNDQNPSIWAWKLCKTSSKQKSRTYRQFSLDYLSNDPNNLQPQQFISHLKQVKSLKCLKIDLTSLLNVPPSFFHKSFDSLRYLKNLSVIHFEIKSIFFVLQHLNFQNFYKKLPILNKLFKVQVKLSIEVFGMNINEALGLIVLLENLMKLERFTSIHLKFMSSADIVQILDVIDTLKTSKSLKKLSLSLEKCRLFPANRLHELFLPLTNRSNFQRSFSKNALALAQKNSKQS